MKKLMSVLLIVVMVFFVVGCGKEEAKESYFDDSNKLTGAAVAEPAKEEVKAADPLVEEETADEEVVEGTTASGPICKDNAIEMDVTNPSNELTVTLGLKAFVFINGVKVAVPDCDKLTLAPGETVHCTDITGPVAVRKGKDNKIIIKAVGASSEMMVYCPED